MGFVICCGETLIDMVADEGMKFHANAGGAPANVAVDCVALGVRSAFLGKRGDDHFGDFLAESLEQKGVDVSGFVKTDEAKTGLVFVFRDGGEPQFLFYTKPRADELWDKKDVPQNVFKDADWFHFGSISLYSKRSDATTNYALKMAKKSDLIVSYDPNLRPHLIGNDSKIMKKITGALDYVDVLKVSEHELLQLARVDEEALALKKMFERGIRLVAVTRGAKGAGLYVRSGGVGVSPPRMNVVDATGAGDAFMASLIVRIMQLGICDQDALEKMGKEMLLSVLEFAVEISARSTEHIGATTGVRIL